MLSVGSSSTLDSDLSLLGLEAVRHTLLQQAVKLDPILDLDLSAGVDRRGFQSLTGLVVGCLAGLLNSMNNGRFVERSLVFYINLSERMYELGCCSGSRDSKHSLEPVNEVKDFILLELRVLLRETDGLHVDSMEY